MAPAPPAHTPTKQLPPLKIIVNARFGHVQATRAPNTYHSGRRAPNTIRGGAPRIQFGAERPEYHSGRSVPNTIRGGAPERPEHHSGRCAPNTIRGGADGPRQVWAQRGATAFRTPTVRRSPTRVWTQPWAARSRRERPNRPRRSLVLRWGTAHGRYWGSAGRRPFARRLPDVRREQNLQKRTTKPSGVGNGPPAPATTRLAQPAERKALNLVVVGSSPRLVH